jgi:phage-related protein
MNQLAKSLLGASANQKDLYEALQDGTLSIEDMNNEVIRLDTEGGQGFSSFAEQAQGATGGIATSFTNVKTAITKGVANSITAINEGLKDANLPTIQEMLANLKGYINSFFKEVNAKIPEIISKAKDIFDIMKSNIPTIIAIGTAFASWKIGTIVQTAIQSIQGFKIQMSLLKLEIASAGGITGVLKTAMASLNAVMSANVIALVVMAIVALIAIFVVLWNKCDWFREFWINLWDKIKETVLNVKDSIATFFTETIPNWINSVIEWFQNLPYNIGYAIGQIIGHIIQFGIDAWNWVTTELPKIIQGIIQWFANLPSNIWNWLVNTIQKIKDWIISMKNTIAQKIPEVIDSIINWFKTLPSNMQNIGKNIVEGLWNGIKNAKDWLVGKIKDFASGITDGIKEALGIHSPSTIMRDKVGKFIPSGIAVGIEANTKSIDKAVDKMNDTMISKMQSAVNMETGKISANATVRSNANYNSVIQVNATFDGNVDIDGKKAGRIITPYVTQTIKTGGLA